MSAQPFAGIEVVEFGQFIAVPFCAQLLGEGGARVIKVESPEGDPVRQIAALAPGESRHYLSRNRGKRSLPLQLRHPAAGRVVGALLARADVALTNFRPGLAEELGLDFPTLSRRYPRLVVGNVSAFGRRGPDAALAGMDLVVQARSGLMAANGRVRDGLPVAPEPPMADYMTAMTLAFGVAAALLRRERTGRGGEIEVSLLLSALALQNNAMVRVEAADGAAHAHARETLAGLRRAAVPWLEQIALLPQVRTLAMTGLYYRTYATRDGVIAVACVSRALQRGFMKVVGLRDASHDAPIRDPERLERHYAELGARAEAILRGRATAEWKAAFDDEGVPASDVKLSIEMLDDPQVVANGMTRDLPHPALGAVRVLAPPLALDGEGFRPTGATGAFASETRAILRELGLGDDEVDALVREGVTREAALTGGTT